MSWLGSIVIAILTALTGALLAGTIASLAADWYSVPSREGAAGYFVVGFILLALIVGLILGLVVSRTIAGRPDPGFLKALGWSQLFMLGTILVIGGLARLLADVGPRIGGKDLMVNIEFRWPQGQEPPAATEQWWVELASVSGNVQRNNTDGPVWREDARLEDGYWIVPGAVNLYTSRGDRTFMLRPNGILPMGYMAPIPAWPGTKDLEWSPWYPTQKKKGPPPPNEFRFRYRLVQAGSPLRTQRFGDFEVTLNAESVGGVTYTGQPRQWTASGTYSLRYKGKPVVIQARKTGEEVPPSFDTVSAVALVGGEKRALLVMANAEQGYGEITLLVPEGDSLRTEYVAHGPGLSYGKPLTNDTAVFQRVASRFPIDGQVDTLGYSTPGLYLFSNAAILDTRSLSVRRIETERISNLIDRINPLALSPDEKSFVQLAYDPETTERNVFAVTNTVTGKVYNLPISRTAMRWGEYDDLSPLHVNHYLTWARNAEGHDTLAARERVQPLPYRGRFSSSDVDYREYRVYLAKESLRPATIAWLASEMGGTDADTTGDFAHNITVSGQKVNVSYSKDDAHVGIWVDRGGDVSLVTKIGEAFNAALATGKFDGHFRATDASPDGED